MKLETNISQMLDDMDFLIERENIIENSLIM